MKAAREEQFEMERFRNYLRILAQAHIHPRLHAKLDASDVVQQTLVQAWQGRDAFRGQNEAQQAAWLRRILGNCLADLLRDWSREKRDVGREQPIQAALDASSANLASWLAAEQASPSEQAVQADLLARLADSLAALPDAQREALTLHHLSGWTLQQVSDHMERSIAAVAGLIKRGLQALRVQIDDFQESQS